MHDDRREIIVIEMAAAFISAVPYEALAGVALGVHLVWILWVIFGALLTRHRPLLSGFHIISLIYGIVIEVAPWPCPLTLLEQHLESLAGIAPYRGPFLVHYLDAVVYPDVPEPILISFAVVVCGANLYLYMRRLRRHAARS
jgi:hypothetical protein